MPAGILAVTQAFVPETEMQSGSSLKCSPPCVQETVPVGGTFPNADWTLMLNFSIEAVLPTAWMEKAEGSAFAAGTVVWANNMIIRQARTARTWRPCGPAIWCEVFVLWNDIMTPMGVVRVLQAMN